jgi:hypothetical protein
MKKKAKKRRQVKQQSFINLEPTIDDTSNKDQSSAARTLIRRIAEARDIRRSRFFHVDQKASAPVVKQHSTARRWRDVPHLMNHVNRMHQRMNSNNLHDGVHDIPPTLRHAATLANVEMHRQGWQPNNVTQEGGPHLNSFMHKYVEHYAPLFAAKRASQQESLDEAAKNYVVNARTPARTLGQLARRKDSIGQQARAERARRTKQNKPTNAKEIIHKHIMGGKKKPKLREFEAAASTLHPYTLARTLKTAVQERKKWDSVKQYHAKVRRQERAAVAAKHKAELEAIRAQVKSQREALAATKKKKPAPQAKPKKPKAKGKTKAAKTLAPKPTPPPKPTKLTAKERAFIAKALVKAPPSATTFTPVETKPQETKTLARARKRLAGGNISATPSPGTLIPREKTGREAQKRPPPMPPLPPMPEPKVIQQQPEIVRDDKGRQYNGVDYYLARGGHINRWDELHKAWEIGADTADSDLPHQDHYKNDPRAVPPSSRTMFWNRKKWENNRSRGKMFQNARTKKGQ